MKYRYYICDVFTETRLGRHLLALLPPADGLGRTDTLLAREDRRHCSRNTVGGDCVLVSEGLIHVD